MFAHGKTVTLYIFYELWWYDDYPTLEKSFFGAVKLVKNVDIDKYKYFGYGIGFDRHETFSVAGGFGKNVIIFGVVMSSSVHLINKKKFLHKSYLWGSYTSIRWYNTNNIKKSIQSILLSLKRNFASACIIMEQIVICLLIVLKFINLILYINAVVDVMILIILTLNPYAKCVPNVVKNINSKSI